MKLPVLAFLGLALLLAGCAQLTTSGLPAELTKARRVFVEERLNDSLGVHRALVAELESQSYEARSGPLTMMPENTQLVVTYDARETWDFRPYLIELHVAVRPAADYNRIVASARYFRPGVTNKPADEMVRELVRKLFPERKP